MNITKITAVAALALLTAACSGTRCQTRGCPNTMVVSDTAVVGTVDTKGKKPVLFNFDSATLTPAGRATLAKYTDCLKKNDKKVEIAGYTDSTGDEAYNLGLSQRRADAAKAYFVEQGIAANRLTTKGYGETNFVADNETAAGRAQNRRIEIKVQ